MPMPRTYTDADLRSAVASSTTWAEVGRKLGDISRARHARVVAANLDIDWSHFVGQSWNKGRRTRVHITEKLGADSGFIKNLRELLIEDGVKEARCERCKETEWDGYPIPLEIDHVNGVNTDNRLENLRILCCNCHALTPTWRRRK